MFLSWLLVLALTMVTNQVSANPEEENFVVENKTDASFDGIRFREPIEKVQQQLVAKFGQPQSVSATEIVYNNIKFNGRTYSKGVFKFDKDSKGGTYFNEVRFTQKEASAKNALRSVQLMAKEMNNLYPGVTIDTEDTGNIFYVGGTSPLDCAYLFTIFYYRTNTGFESCLRYGPFHFVR